MKRVYLAQIAHARSGDKGDDSNVGVIADSPEVFEILQRELTRDRVERHFAGICRGGVTRYDVPNLNALNFILHDSLGGGGTASLKTDAQGKTHGQAMLLMEIEVPDEEESRIVEVSIDDYISDSKRAMPVREGDAGKQYLTTVYLLFEGKPLTIDALLDKSAEIWGFDTNNRAGAKTIIMETDSIRKALAGYDETDVPAFILRNFDRKVNTSSQGETEFEKTLLKVGEGMVFILGQVERL